MKPFVLACFRYLLLAPHSLGMLSCPRIRLKTYNDLEHTLKHLFSWDHESDLVDLASLRKGMRNQLMIISGGSGILKAHAFRPTS
jgi:hypothetical protein